MQWLGGIVSLVWTAVVLSAGPSVAQTLSVTLAQNLSFPTTAIPTSAATTLAVSPLNSSTSGTATILFGTANRAQINMSMSKKGGPAFAISVDITGITVSNPNVTLGTFRGLYSSTQINSFPSPTLALPAVTPATTPLYLGATITAQPGVTTGPCNGSFTVTITVQ